MVTAYSEILSQHLAECWAIPKEPEFPVSETSLKRSRSISTQQRPGVISEGSEKLSVTCHNGVLFWYPLKKYFLDFEETVENGISDNT